MSADLWVVAIGNWHFGPFAYEEALRFEREHDGKSWPLWDAEQVDALSGELALVRAKEEAA